MKPMSASLVVTIAAATALYAGPSSADDFYAGKTVNVIVGYAPGGGADLWGRFFARNIGRHIPGQPQVVVRNMPGAGGFIAVNHVYNVAAMDGTVLLMPTTTAITAPSMGLPNTRWDTLKFQWIGNLTRDVSTCVASGVSGIKGIADGKSREIIFGSDGNDDPASHHPRILRNLFGYKTKVIAGFKGTGPAFLALDRGEIDARCSVWASLAMNTKREELKTGKLVPLVQMSTKGHPIFGNAPTIYDLARNEEDRQILNFLVGPLELSRPVAVGPGVPSERVALLRKAFWAAAHSDELKAEAKKMNLSIDPMTGEETEKAIAAAINVPASTMQKAIQLIKN